MQSLEEEALLKGTLAILDGKSSPMVMAAEAAGRNGKAFAAKRGGRQRTNEEGTCGGGGSSGDDGDEPQTDGDDTDSYSDEVRR